VGTLRCGTSSTARGAAGARVRRHGAGRVAAAVIVALALVVAIAACGGEDDVHASKPNPSPNGTTKAQLAEARRLVNIGALKTEPPTSVVNCVAHVVVQNPLLDQAANDIAQIADKDLRQAVMFSYLQCGYNYILDSYMRFAPADLGKAQLACVRSKFTQLDRQTFAEVIVLDPDAGYTGPLVIQACKSGSKTNPLLQKGYLEGMGGS
jgi:hypothetical protein